MLPSGHSPDREWWWNGDAWLPAYSGDRLRWFNGHVWVKAVPTWRRWTYPIGLTALVIGFGGASAAGIAVMGDPGPGQTDVADPFWFVPAAISFYSLMIIGVALLLASPIWRFKSRTARSR